MAGRVCDLGTRVQSTFVMTCMAGGGRERKVVGGAEGRGARKGRAHTPTKRQTYREEMLINEDDRCKRRMKRRHWCPVQNQ